LSESALDKKQERDGMDEHRTEDKEYRGYLFICGFIGGTQTLNLCDRVVQRCCEFVRTAVR
jgi:hypothetical protein